MGLFNFFNKNKENTGSGDVSNTDAISKINLRKETVNKICLEKKELTDLTSRVAVALDFSGSMEDDYKQGLVQDIVERVLPIAMKFDDDGEADVYLFSNSVYKAGTVNINNILGFIDKAIKGKKNLMRGTNFAPVLKTAMDKYAKKNPSKVPTYLLFITDGDNWDRNETTEVLREMSRYNIFVQFISIKGIVLYLQGLDDMSGRFIDNANYFDLSDIYKISDESLYRKLLEEYPAYLKEAKNKGLI